MQNRHNIEVINRIFINIRKISNRLITELYAFARIFVKFFRLLKTSNQSVSLDLHCEFYILKSHSSFQIDEKYEITQFEFNRARLC